MAGKTTNYGLPTLEGTDQIAIVTDYNALANGVDTALKGVEDKTAPSTVTTTSGDFVTSVTAATANVINKITTATVSLVSAITGTPTTKTIATYADIDGHPELLTGYTVTATKANALKSATGATTAVVTGVTAATDKAVTSVSLSSN